MAWVCVPWHGCDLADRLARGFTAYSRRRRSSLGLPAITANTEKEGAPPWPFLTCARSLLPEDSRRGSAYGVGARASHASPGEKQRDDLGLLLAGGGNFVVERPGRVGITGCSGSCSADTTADWERSLLCLPHVRKTKEDRWMRNEEWR
jgi:hypothetical protein